MSGVQRRGGAPDPGSGAELERAGYLGPEGTFSEEALLASAAPGAVQPYALASIRETALAVGEGEVGWAIVPIENSLEGSITSVLDLLAEQPELEIVGEALLRVRHSLVGPRDIELGRIEAVVTHPQVPGQCSRFLRAELPRARIEPASSTAEAVRAVVQAGRAEQAAIGTGLAARIYGGVVLREEIEDRPDNETRFVWLARTGDGREPPLAAAGGERKTSLVFWGSGAERPGWLVRCLDEFARREINLTKIESRPRRRELGSYMFFADLAASTDEPRVAEAIDRLRRVCEEVRVLGSYAAAAR
jgi:prephenate dehydratase